VENKSILIFYSLWSIITFFIVFSKGMNPDNFTHILIIIFLFLQFLSYPLLYFFSKILNPKLFFITSCIIFAGFVEGFYMFSKPVFDSLTITLQTDIQKIVTNYLIDLLFTIPVYFMIFMAIWYFINRYDYKIWEYLLFISLGQALGDGGFFFAANPFMLLFLPYVMINYHAMNLTPYLLIKKRLKEGKSNLLKYIIPILSIILIYYISGALIKYIGSFFGFK
jgi:hypothetical protein